MVAGVSYSSSTSPPKDVSAFSDRDSIPDDLCQAYDNNLINDLTFSLDDGTIVQSNKFVLCFRSEYFAEMLLGPMRVTDMGTIPLNCSLSSFAFISDYVWKGSVEFSKYSIETLLPAMEKCREYLIAGGKLTKATEAYLVDHLSNTDYIDVGSSRLLAILQFSLENPFEDLSNAVCGVILSNIVSISESKDFESLTYQALITILRSRSKSCVREIDVVKALEKWINSQAELEESHKKSLLDLIELRKISNKDLLGQLKKMKLFNSEEIYNIIEENEKQPSKNRMVDALLYILANQNHSSVNDQLQAFNTEELINIVHDMEQQERCDLGPEIIDTMMKVVQQKFDSSVCDEVLETAWEIMWALCDRVPGNSRHFLDQRGLEVFLCCKETFPQEKNLMENMLGLLTVVVAYRTNRPRLMTSAFVRAMNDLLDPQDGEVNTSYFAAEVVAHLASDGPSAWLTVIPERDLVLARLVRGSSSWVMNGLAYETLIDVIKLLNVEDIECVLWATKTIASLVDRNVDRYCPLLTKQGGLKSILTNIKRIQAIMAGKEAGPEQQDWLKQLLIICHQIWGTVRQVVVEVVTKDLL